jgi:hypothetical protein
MKISTVLVLNFPCGVFHELENLWIIFPLKEVYFFLEDNSINKLEIYFSLKYTVQLGGSGLEWQLHSYPDLCSFHYVVL